MTSIPEKAMGDEFGPAHEALNRMHRASMRGTGCTLTAEMIRSLAVTVLGEIWSSPDPREPTAALKPSEK